MESSQSAAATGSTGPDNSESIAELVDRISKRIVIAVVAAGALVAMAIYWRPAPTHFEAFVAGGEVFRINTKTGTIIACNAARCMTVVKRGRHLVGAKEGRLFQGPRDPHTPKQ